MPLSALSLVPMTGTAEWVLSIPEKKESGLYKYQGHAINDGS
jgi:hypothetical protein